MNNKQEVGGIHEIEFPNGNNNVILLIFVYNNTFFYRFKNLK